MALRAVPDHPKFADLKRRLGVGKAVTLGYLEAIWHFTGRFTPQGNIGKYQDSAIEAWIEWTGEPGALVAALIESGWIDRDETHRLLVHDWAQHADKATKQGLNRARLEFCVPTVHTGRTRVDSDTPKLGTAWGLPEPVPVPVPEPGPEPEPGPVLNPFPEPPSALGGNGGQGVLVEMPTPEGSVSGKSRVDRDFEEDWQKFWARVGKDSARRAYAKARKRVPRDDLMAAVCRHGPLIVAHAQKQGIMPVYPATWLNAGRWDDDPAIYEIRLPQRQETKDEQRKRALVRLAASNLERMGEANENYRTRS